jgi:uncharacterized DUF497 family protein
MIDFQRITGFDWDEGNRRKNFDSHGVADFEAEEIFLGPSLIIAPDLEHSQKEPRWVAYGMTAEARGLTIVFTLRAERTLIRIVSARDMSRKERKIHGQKT